MNKAIQLTIPQLQSMKDNGYCYVEVSPFNFVKFTTKDLYVNKKDAEKILKRDTDK